MVGDAVAHGFDQDWFAAAGKGHVARFFRGLSYGEYVVAVYADGVDTVADASAGDAVASVLFQRGGRDCVAIIATDEYDRA